MFEGIKKISNLIWVGIAALISLIVGLFIRKSCKKTEMLDEKTKELIVKNAIDSSGFTESFNNLKASVNDLITDKSELVEKTKKQKLELDKYKELVRRSMDLTLSPEENLQASIELARLNGVPEDEIIKTPEEGKKYFTE